MITCNVYIYNVNKLNPELIVDDNTKLSLYNFSYDESPVINNSTKRNNNSKNNY